MVQTVCIYILVSGSHVSVEFVLADQVGNMQLVTLMAETMGNSVDPSSLVGMDDDAGSVLSQAATQPE